MIFETVFALALAATAHAVAIRRQEQPALEDLLALICESTAGCTGTATCQSILDLSPEPPIPISFCLEPGQTLPMATEKRQGQPALDELMELICMDETECTGEATCQLLSELIPELAEFPILVGFCLAPGQEFPIPQKKRHEQRTVKGLIKLICVADDDCTSLAMCQLLGDPYPDLEELPIPIGFATPDQEISSLLTGRLSGGSRVQTRHIEREDDLEVDASMGALVTFIEFMCVLGTLAALYRVFGPKPGDS